MKINHGKIYKIDKKGGSITHVGEVHGGFIQYLPMLASVLGPAVGQLLSGVTKKIFGEGNYILEHGGKRYELPDTKVHKRGGAGIMDILSIPFKLISSLVGGSTDQDIDGVEIKEGSASFDGGASFGEGFKRKPGRPRKNKGSSLSGMDADAPPMLGGDSNLRNKKKKVLIFNETGETIKAPILDRIIGLTPTIGSPVSVTGKGSRLGKIKPINIYQLP